MYKANAMGSGNTSKISCRDHVIDTDVPKALGGRDQAPQPVELLLAALIGCETATATYVARHMKPRLQLERIDFEYAAERNDLGAQELPIHKVPSVQAGLQRVSGRAVVHLKAASPPEPPERLETLKEYVEQRCPVANTLKAGGCKLDIEWVLSETKQPE